MALTISAATSATARFDDTKGVSKKRNTIDTFTKQPIQKTPQQKAADSKKAIDLYKKQGYKITQQSDGSYLMEDKLGHKSKVQSFGLDEKGHPTALVLQVQIVDPSQKERFEKRMRGEKETDAERAKYEKQAIAKMKNAGYKLQPKGDGRYILTAPDGSKSLITRPDIDLDGGASWTVLPVHLTDNKPKFNALY